MNAISTALLALWRQLEASGWNTPLFSLLGGLNSVLMIQEVATGQYGWASISVVSAACCFYVAFSD